MIEIAYLTGASYKGQPIAPGSLPALDAPSHQALVQAGAAHGLAFPIVRWDDAAAIARHPAALIRSCWDYLQRPEAFVAALEAAEAAGVRLFNPAAVVRWNIRKRYLAALEAAGVPSLPTLWTERVDAAFVTEAFERLDAEELVLKPEVGGGSWRTVRLKRGAWTDADLLEAPPGAALAQPFLPTLGTHGELSLHHFSGAFSHAVRKLPPAGGWLANHPQAAITPHTPDHAQRQTALAAIAAVTGPLLYARVDLVRVPAGDWRVIELEAVEPHLHLAYAEGAADRLCLALRAALG